MKFILYCAVILVLGYGLFTFADYSDGGYVKIFLGEYLVEVSFFVFVVGFLMTLFLLYFLIRTVVNLFKTPKRVSNWNNQRNQRVSQNKLGNGFLSLMQGDWKRAEKQLLAKTDTRYNQVPYVNFLAAAQAAQEQGKYEQRDYYLAQAAQQAPKNKLAINMTKARLHQQAGQHDAALTALLEVKDEGKKNQQFTAMLVQAYDHKDDFDSLQEILPQARRIGALPDTVLNDIQADIDIDSFQKASDKEMIWKKLSKTSKQDADFIKVYAEYQLSNGRPDIAEKLIRTTLKKAWDDGLVNTYGRIVSTQHKKLLRNVEGWLLARPENVELYVAAGRLAAQGQDFSRAEKAFEEAIKLSKSPEAYEGLGKLYEENQDLRKALSLYRSGLHTSNAAITSNAMLEKIEMSGADEEIAGVVESDAAKEEHKADVAGAESTAENAGDGDAQQVVQKAEAENSADKA